MARIHHLFFSADPDKQTLHRRIIPNQKQQELQQERWNDLRDYLIADLGEASGREVTSWLQGSYKFGTQVRPVRKGDEFDIDLGVYFNWSGNANDDNFSPQTLKMLVQESLRRYKEEAEDVIEVVEPPKERCSRIRFPGDFHIDVPVYQQDDEWDTRKLATESDTWEDSDPRAFLDWFQNNFPEEDGAQVRRLIRYIKAWAALHLKDQSPSSMLLTVLVADAYKILTEDLLDGDDQSLRSVCTKIYERLNNDSEVRNPVNAGENLNRMSEEESKVVCEKLSTFIEIADKALAAATECTSASIWAEAFHHFFPVPAADSNLQSRALVPVQFIPDVLVKAIPRENQHRTYEGANRVGPIPRNCDISFKLRNAHMLPRGVVVQWIVRNEGEEAEYINDLGHLAGTDPEHAKENSAYKGTHYMDVVVSQPFGEVLGFRRIPVEISGAFMPPRNPKKPGYTRIRRR